MGGERDRAPDPVCAGCLGTAECWVCLGTGACDTPGRLQACHSCGGTRVCRYCAESDTPRRRATDRVEPLTP